MVLVVLLIGLESLLFQRIDARLDAIDAKLGRIEALMAEVVERVRQLEQ